MTASKLDIHLGDVMTRQPHSLSPMDQVQRADQLCKSYSIHHLPVVNIYGKVIGIISEADLLKASYGLSLFRNQDPDRFNKTLYTTLLVRDIMTKDVVTLSTKNTIADALVIFEMNRFHAIPVLEEERLVGIVTPLDLLRVSFSNTN